MTKEDIVNVIAEMLHWELSDETEKALESLSENALMTLKKEIGEARERIREPLVVRINDLKKKLRQQDDSEELKFLRFMYWKLRERAGLPPTSYWIVEQEYGKPVPEVKS